MLAGQLVILKANPSKGLAGDFAVILSDDGTGCVEAYNFAIGQIQGLLFWEYAMLSLDVSLMFKNLIR